MGDEFAVNTFLRTFVPPVQKWLASHAAFDPQASVLCARLPLFRDGRLEYEREPVNCSLTKYADDLTKKLVLPRGAEPHELATLSRLSNQCLDELLAEVGFAQNLTKQDTLLHVQGPGAATCLRDVRAGRLVFPGKPVQCAKSLGSWMSSVPTSYEFELKS
eukprot:1813666-Pyramimonas_sp.AAC.1